MTKFKIYGDRGYTSERLLAEVDSYSEGRGWIDAFAPGGDTGAYKIIELAWFKPDGECVTEYAVNRAAADF